jgi:uncharacterized protein (DUF736 family)|tara:strand:+ start:147 stop:368 length:222 start_codon:yes stop_codon:yes gene_type:complete
MAFQLKEDYGSLWKNENKSKDNQPDYTGKINIGGSVMSLGAWKNTTDGGKTYLSIKLSEVQEQKSPPSDGEPF